jgi:hypothetical protein
MIAGNFSNNFQYVPEWLWDKHITALDFVMYMALWNRDAMTFGQDDG